MKNKPNEERILFKLIIFFLPLIFFYLVSCEDNGVEPINPEGIWPLQTGNVWTYKIKKPSWMNDAILQMEITGKMTIDFDGRSYTVAKLAFYGVGEPV